MRPLLPEVGNHKLPDAYARQDLKAHQDGLPLPDEKITVGKYLDGWLEKIAKPRLRESTYTSYEHIIRRHIKPGLGRIKLARLSPRQI